MEGDVFKKTEDGTPQGGIISPTLCNVALNGLQKHVEKGLKKATKTVAGIHLFRFADDVILSGLNPEALQRGMVLIQEFIKERGLELNETKTHIIDIHNGFN